MKTIKLMGLIGAAVVSISATAFAYTDTDYIVIGALEASQSSADGYRVYPAKGYSIPEVAPCLYHDFAEMQTYGPTNSEPTLWEKDLMARQLTTAFWGARKVKLRLDGCGKNKRPAYRIVTLDKYR